MASMNQQGIAPVMLIGSLLVLGTLTAVGTYFALEYTKPTKQPIVQPAQNTATPPAEVTTIEQVKEANKETLLSMEGVEKVEVGEKDGQPCVVVFSFKETDELQNLENSGLGGYEVVVQNAAQTN